MSIRILVADDFELLREDMCEVLSLQPDFQVVGSAGSGAEAVELAARVPYDILLMDIEMEQVNAGILAAEKIRDANPDAKIIFLTAHETENMITVAMATGAVDYVVKGGKDEELFRHIRLAYEGRPMLDPDIQGIVMKEYSRLRRSESNLLFFINNISRLTPTERELVRCLLQDMSVKDIAAQRCVEPGTVKAQIKSLRAKFGCSRTHEIVDMIRGLNISHLF